MFDFFARLFDASGFEPGHVGPGWSRELLWFHHGADLLIWMAFMAIPTVLVYFIHRRKQLPYPWVFWMFGVFIVSCGFTHLMEVVTCSVPVYRLATLIKVITAVASGATVIALIPLVPRLLALRSTEELEREIGERQRAEYQLRQYAAEVEDLYNRAPCGYHSVDPEGRLVRVNDTELAWLGYTRTEVLGRSFAEFMTTASGVAFLEDLAQLKERGSVSNLEYDLRRKDGTILPALLSATAVRDQAGHLVGSRSILFDNSDRKRAEARFRKLLESAPDAMLIVNNDGCISLVNSQTETLFGYTREELLGQRAEVLMPERLRAAGPKNGSGYYSRPPLQPRLEQRELHGLRKDGTEFPVEVTHRPLETDEGVLFVSAIRDISERRRVEQALARHTAELARSEEAYREQSKILRSILDSISDGVIVTNERGRFLLINPAAEHVLGRTHADEVTGTWTKRSGLYLPDKTTPYPLAELPLVRAVRGESVDGAEMYVRHAQFPTGMWVSANARPLRDDQGKVRGGVIVFRDVTERKEAEEKLKSFAARLERSNRELQDFASVASHDLQEPLRKIQAFGDRLQSRCAGVLDEQGHDYLQRMLAAAGRMQNLINDLLAYSRVASKAHPFARVNLAEVAREVVCDLEARIHQTAGRVEIGPLPVIDADALQMRQLLQNLIGNGLKFHRPEAPPVIRVEAELMPPAAEAEAPAVQLRVADNGIGFEEKYRNRLFQVFQRLHARHEYEGTGMGLAICRRIAERHGGGITAHSTPGAGATFVVTLPTAHLTEEETTP